VLFGTPHCRQLKIHVFRLAVTETNGEVAADI
jgi:hypothetical protein